MTTLTMISWKQRLPTVSLVRAIRDYSTAGSLEKALREVEKLFNGKSVVLQFESEQKRAAFKLEAEAMGVNFGYWQSTA